MRIATWIGAERSVVAGLWLLGLACVAGCSDGSDVEPDDPAGENPSVNGPRERDGRAEGEPRLDLPGPLPALGAVWGLATDDVWAVGADGAILHFDGSRWTASPSASREALLGVHGTASDDVWAVGEGIIQHWDGSTWEVRLDGIPDALLAVWAAGPDDVWIAGFDKHSHNGVVHHWNGKRFLRQMFEGGASVWEIWGAAPNSVWMAGETATDTGFVAQGSVEGLAPNNDFSGRPLRGVWGQDESDIWFLAYQGPMQHWDGESFTEFELGEGSERPLLGIAGSATDDVWAVGLRGAVMHWDGATWSQTPVDTDATLWSVWAPDANNAWAVGGTLMHWNGERWRDLGQDSGAARAQ